MRLSNTPQEVTVLRLEQRKSFTCTVLVSDTSGARVDLGDAVLTLDWLINLGKVDRLDELTQADVRSVSATMVEPAYGHARFDVQAADLDLGPGSYPFTMTLRFAGFSVVVLKGTIELQQNAEFASVEHEYLTGQPAQALEVQLRGTGVIDVEVGSMLPPGTQFLTDDDKAKLDLLQVADGGLVVDLSDYATTFELEVTQTALEGTQGELAELVVTAGSLADRVAQTEAALAARTATDAAGFRTFSGEMRMWAGPTPPTGWLLCQGQILMRADYPALFAVVGTAYTGAATVTAQQFRLPALQTRVPMGAEATYFPLGAYGGAQTHQLSVAQMPSHTHVQNAHTHAQNAHGHYNYPDTNFYHFRWGNGGGVNVHLSGAQMQAGAPPANELATVQAGANQTQLVTATNIAATAVNQYTGGGEAFSILQSYTPVHFIIKT